MKTFIFLTLLVFMSFVIAVCLFGMIQIADASAGFPGTFQGGLTTGYKNIGACQKQKSNTTLGFPGVFQGGLTTCYKGIGAVQKNEPSGGGGGGTTFPLIIWFDQD